MKQINFSLLLCLLFLIGACSSASDSSYVKNPDEMDDMEKRKTYVAEKIIFSPICDMFLSF